jgi:hypothetical protein
MPIDDQLKMQILLGELDPRGQRRPGHPRRAGPSGVTVLCSLATLIVLAVIAAVL